MYSIDISQQRLDEQDKKIIQHAIAQEWKIKKALILGSGKGRISIALALLGFEIVCIDIEDNAWFYKQANDLFNFQKPITFIKQDIRDLQAETYKNEFSLVLGQRIFHYLTYDEHKRILTDVLPRYMTKKSYLYTAVSCIDSAMGIEYKAMKEYVENRFGKLSPLMQERFSLKVPVCLYSLKEYKQLMKDTHFSKVSLYQTSFGNIKGLYKL